MFSKEILAKNIFYLCVGVACVVFYLSLVAGTNVSSKYYWALSISALFGIIAYIYYGRYLDFKRLRELKENWGKYASKKRDFSWIRMYYDYEVVKDEVIIDDRTWADLNMDEIYAKVDRTLTSAGQHVLYDILRKPLLDKDGLKKRGELVNHFQADTKTREALQRILLKAETFDNENAAYLLWENVKIHKSVVLHSLLFLYALLSPCLLLISIPVGAAGIAIAFLINMKVHYSVQKRIQGHFPAVKHLGRLVKCALSVCKLDDELLSEFKVVLNKNLESISDLHKKVGLIGMKNFEDIYQYISIFYLIEVRTFWKVMQIVNQNKKKLRLIYRELGMLDALLSIASFREGLSVYCQPQLSVNKCTFQIDSAYHPLLDEPVPNSIVMKKPGVLITGSNMSGKSTFLRTIGVNVLFAQSTYTCFAQSYCGTFYELLTSIGRSDNVIEGKSYYLVEAQALLRIIDSVNNGLTTFCIVDEIFRGTNSVERITSAKYVLEYLIKEDCLTFVATHDLELTEMLEGVYMNCHFRESVGESGLEFDYLLKKGPSTTKNAIKLLKFLGYPDDITKPAEEEVHGS